LLADDHPIFRQGVAALMKDLPDILVVGEASDGNEAIIAAHSMEPDVVVVDVGMPNLDGLLATRMIKEQMPHVGIIILSISDDEQSITRALEAGALGYLPKQTVANELVTAIRQVHGGNAYFSPSIQRRLVDIHKGLVKSLRTTLTAREREVLQFVADGRSSREIAEILHIGTASVNKCRQRIMDKVDKHDVVSLVRWAIDEGIVTSK
jgi:DNA-binding NarL/FixJ family response regulator